MANLVTQLEDLAESFISSIIAAVRAASVAEVLQTGSASGAAGGRALPSRSVPASTMTAPAQASPSPPRPGRRPRASAAEVQAQKNTAYAAAKVLRKDFSKGDVMKKSGSQENLGRALSLLVAEGKLGKKGDRRKTRYWVK